MSKWQEKADRLRAELAKTKAERLLPCDPWCGKNAGKLHLIDCPYKYRPAVAAALREQGKENQTLKTQRDWWRGHAQDYQEQIADLRAENDNLKHELLTIGDMAVVDFDDAVVGMVDKAVPNPPKTYAERRRAEIEQNQQLRAELAKAQAERDALKIYNADLLRERQDAVREAFQSRAELEIAIERGTRLEGLEMALDICELLVGKIYTQWDMDDVLLHVAHEIRALIDAERAKERGE